MEYEKFNERAEFLENNHSHEMYHHTDSNGMGPKIQNVPPVPVVFVIGKMTKACFPCSTAEADSLILQK